MIQNRAEIKQTFGAVALFVNRNHLVSSGTFYTYYTRARVCEKNMQCTYCTFCTRRAVHNFFFAEGDSCGFGKVEHCAQMYVAMFRGECVGEYPVGLFTLIFGGHAAETVKIAASGFAAICGDGKCQLYVLNVSRGDIRSCRFDCLGEAA